MRGWAREASRQRANGRLDANIIARSMVAESKSCTQKGRSPNQPEAQTVPRSLHHQMPGRDSNAAAPRVGGKAAICIFVITLLSFVAETQLAQVFATSHADADPI